MTAIENNNALQLRLQRFVAEITDESSRELQRVRAEASSRGMMQSSRRFFVENETLIGIFRSGLSRIAWFVFQCAGNGPNEVMIFETAVHSLFTNISQSVRSSRQRAGSIAGNSQSELDTGLQNIIADAIFDFQNGIAGGQTLKKGQDISVTNIMNQSPGAIQQGGVGNVAQTDTSALLLRLVEELKKIENLPELEQIDSESKVEILDIVEAVSDEASKQSSDLGKLQRWGGRLIGKLEEFGMSATASAIGSIIGNLAA